MKTKCLLVFATIYSVAGFAQVPALSPDKAVRKDIESPRAAYVISDSDPVADGALRIDLGDQGPTLFSNRAMITQTFDDIAARPDAAPGANGVCALSASFTAAGWFAKNNSSQLGANCLAQGFSTRANTQFQFPAQAGGSNSFAGMTFSATTAGTISVWLVSPVVTFTANSSLEFWTRGIPNAAGTAQAFPDRLQVRTSTVSAGTPNVGTAPADVGDFTNLALDLNSNLSTAIAACPDAGLTNPPAAVQGYPMTAAATRWCRIRLEGAAGRLPTSGQGRIAFRYFVDDGGLNGANSFHVGIDSFAFEEGLPPPGFSCSDLQPVVGQWGETNNRCGNITSAATTPKFESARLDGGLDSAESRGGPMGYAYTVEARINRPRQPTAANSIFVHGTPNPLQSGSQWWNRKLAFNISGDGRYSIFRYNGTARPAAIQAWTQIIGASVAAPPATNTLQVVSNGSTLSFVLNGVTLRTINSEFAVEDFGIGFVRSVPGTGSAADDWIEIVDATTDAGTLIEGGDTGSGVVSAEQEAANLRGNSADQLQVADPFFAPGETTRPRK